jgi:predicted metal-dependent phosphoesterase TrpH
LHDGRENLPLKIDLHVHSYYSADSTITSQELVHYAQKAGLDGVAVTDHDNMDGATKIAQETGFFIVPGMEVASLQGHVVALNIQKPIPSKLDISETIEKIHVANGIAIACHPTGLLKGGLGKHTPANVDAVEVINSSALPFRYSVRRNEAIAQRLGKPRVAGSDAHYGPEIGCAYTLIQAEPDANDIVKAIVQGRCQPFGKAIPISLRLQKISAQKTRR